MFQRAAASTSSQAAQAGSVNAPFKPPSQSTLGSFMRDDSNAANGGVSRSAAASRQPLSPKRGQVNHINAAISKASTSPIKELKRQDSTLLRTLMEADDQASRQAPKAVTAVNGAGANMVGTNSVYFDEDDFEDDLDFSFDAGASSTTARPKATPRKTPVKVPPTNGAAKPEAIARGSQHTPIKIPEDSSQPISWPPSTDRGQRNADTSSAMPAKRSPPPVMQAPQPAKKPRNLPWLSQDNSRTTFGPQIRQSRNTSTAAASTAFEEAEEESIFDAAPVDKDGTPAVDRRGILDDPTASALKAMKEEKRRKRPASADGESPRMAGVRRKEVPKTHLSAEQKAILRLVVDEGKSVFYTGSAGTGKSVLLRECIRELKSKHARQPERIAVTASTGLAACNIGGITLHSFAGVGLGKEDAKTLVKKLKRNKKNVTRWLKTSVLIIDEISMVDADWFDKLEEVARVVRKNDKPWGGIQIVVTGDFFQLPPVPDQGRQAKFAFEAAKWGEIDHTVALTSVFRQRDPEFVDMLNEMREGRLTPASIRNFQALSRELDNTDGIDATELFPTRAEVERANNSRMARLKGQIREFRAEDTGTVDDQTREKILSNCMAPKTLQLKKGAQVMLIKNTDDQLVNGSLGIVAGFMDERVHTFCLEQGGENEVAKMCEQGGSLRDSPWPEEMLEGSDGGRRKKMRLLLMQQESSTAKCYPVVCFRTPGPGKHDTYRLVQPESWKTELPNGEVQACRRQVPLILAYAISIHKAQGQTIEKVKVDLGKVFEKGQAYVALSRAVSKAGLQVTRFDAKLVMAHDKVAKFYAGLLKVDTSAIRAANGAAAGRAAGAGHGAQMVTALKNDRERKEREKREKERAEREAPVSTQQVWSQVKRNPASAFFGATKVERKW